MRYGAEGAEEYPHSWVVTFTLRDKPLGPTKQDDGSKSRRGRNGEHEISLAPTWNRTMILGHPARKPCHYTDNVLYAPGMTWETENAYTILVETPTGMKPSGLDVDYSIILKQILTGCGG